MTHVVTTEVLGKRVQQSRSLPSLILWSFLQGTQIPPPLSHPKKKSLGMSSWCAHALLPVAGDAVIHGRRAADELRF